MERFELRSGQAVGGAALLEPVSGEGVGFLSRGTTVLAQASDHSARHSIFDARPAAFILN